MKPVARDARDAEHAAHQAVGAGGTRFVGRAVIEEALDRGWDVTAVHRRVTGAVPAAVAGLWADRTVPGELVRALGEETWDVAVDTWAGASRVATEAARLLGGRVNSYGYVSSGSVYVWGSHGNETSPVVDGDPQAEDGAYPALKRGAELGVLAAFPDALLARAGLILGPYEDIGRLPWWLHRLALGGAVVAPGRPTRPLQYVDVRDLATWLLTGLEGGLAGPVDVISRSGHATTEQLLQDCLAVTGAKAKLVWLGEEELAAAGAQPWTHLPCWVPERGEFAGFLEVDTTRATATGLRCRPITDTVIDTWTWLQRDGLPRQRSDRDIHGLPAELEQQLLSR